MRIVGLILGLLTFAGMATADTLRLKSGGAIQGKIVEESETEYQVETRVGKLRVKRADVLSVERGESDQTVRLKARLRLLLGLVQEGRHVAAWLRWEELQGTPSPVWTSEELQAKLLAELGWDPPAGSPRTFDALRAFLETLTGGLCFGCEGQGSRVCDACAGFGRPACPVCQGETPECEACAGKGVTACGDCGGKGKVRCPGCANSRIPGYLVTEETRTVMIAWDPLKGPVYGPRTFVRKTMCPDCKGQVQGPCGTCATSGSAAKATLGKIACLDCGGTGRQPCEAGCESGRLPEPCAACAGRGRLACPDCGGSGRKPAAGK